MKRAPGESFEEYRERRKQTKLEEKKRSFIRVFFSEGTYRKKTGKQILEKPKPVSPAVGKRHQGESLEDFKKRRKICNARNRNRKKDRIRLLGDIRFRKF